MSTGNQQTVLFDAVGTLIYAAPPVADVYQAAGRRQELELSTREIDQRFRQALRVHPSDSTEITEQSEHRRWRTIVDDVFPELTAGCDELFDELWNHFAQPRSWRVYDDVADCFAALRSVGFELAVASNFDARLIEVCRGHAPLKDLRLFYSSALGYAKPDRRFFAAVEQELSAQPDQLTLVGDDLNADQEGATNAGWQSVLIDRSGTSGEPSLNTLADLPELLASP